MRGGRRNITSTQQSPRSPSKVLCMGVNPPLSASFTETSFPLYVVRLPASDERAGYGVEAQCDLVFPHFNDRLPLLRFEDDSGASMTNCHKLIATAK